MKSERIEEIGNEIGGITENEAETKIINEIKNAIKKNSCVLIITKNIIKEVNIPKTIENETKKEVDTPKSTENETKKITDPMENVTKKEIGILESIENETKKTTDLPQLVTENKNPDKDEVQLDENDLLKIDKFPVTYDISNGERKEFKITLNNMSSVDIYPYWNEDFGNLPESYFIKKFVSYSGVKKIRTGVSPPNTITVQKGKYGKDQKNKNFLLEFSDNDYIFVGNVIIEFMPYSKIEYFCASVGPGDVMYVHMVDDKGSFYFISKKKVRCIHKMHPRYYNNPFAFLRGVRHPDKFFTKDDIESLGAEYYPANIKIIDSKILFDKSDYVNRRK